VQVLLHVGRDRHGRRRLAEIAALQTEPGTHRCHAVTVWHADAGTCDSTALQQLFANRHVP
jgi:pilus assembly protein CpaF